jgi:hypothetical protein
MMIACRVGRRRRSTAGSTTGARSRRIDAADHRRDLAAWSKRWSARYPRLVEWAEGTIEDRAQRA